MKRAHLVVLLTTGGTEATFATEGNKLKVSAMSTTIHGTTIGRDTTMNHLVDIFNDGRTGMQFINDMFVVVGKIDCKIFIIEFYNKARQRKTPSPHE